jgi:pyruvate/2-oxoglutarate dehydrogenase complex dihydrolipoamide acyltransferase (E2) component
VKADAFLTSLGKDDEDDVPRKRRTAKKAAAAAPDPAPAPAAPESAEGADAPAPPPEAATAPPAAEPDPAPPTAPQQRAAEHRTVAEDVAIPGVPAGPRTRRAMPEPVHKTSVDLKWSLKMGLQALVDRDLRGPKAELNDALEAWLKAQGIDIPVWKG